MRDGRAVGAARRQLEMRAGSRHLQEHAFIAVVVFEAADLVQSEAVAVEPNERVEALGVPRHA